MGDFGARSFRFDNLYKNLMRGQRQKEESLSGNIQLREYRDGLSTAIGVRSDLGILARNLQRSGVCRHRIFRRVTKRAQTFANQRQMLALFDPHCNNRLKNKEPIGKQLSTAQEERMKPQKKTASIYQESQELAPGSSSAEVEPMTVTQASHLKTLAEEVGEPGAYRQGLSKAEASRRINVLLEKLRIGELPPHTD